MKGCLHPRRISILAMVVAPSQGKSTEQFRGKACGAARRRIILTIAFMGY